MVTELVNILESFGYPVYLQGSLNPEEPFPDSFFTFWNFTTPEGAFYDNDAHHAVWGFYVYFYSSDPYLTDTVTEQARDALKASGWIPTGRPQDATSGVVTHTGRMFTVQKIESYKGE